jgi:hypothetical protein
MWDRTLRAYKQERSGTPRPDNFKIVQGRPDPTTISEGRSRDVLGPL